MKKLFALVLALATTAPTTAAPVEEDLLEPEKAFALTLKARDGLALEAQWVIAPGYYLYREKFKFEILEGGARITQPVFPAGIRKRDEFFGEVETYRNTVKVLLPLARDQADGQSVRVKIGSQGCADIGVCYPPQTQVVSVQLPPAAPAAVGGGLKSLADLSRLIEPASNRAFLPVDEAFKLGIERLDAGTLLARLRIADGYYLYRDKTRFELTRGEGVKLGAYQLPRGTTKDDPYIGKTEVYYGTLEIKLPLAFTGAQPARIELSASYQGCAEKGICYPPTTQKLSLALPAGGAAAVAATGPAAAPPATSPERGDRPKTSTEVFLFAVLAAFGTGLLLTFTPCVLPLIPILSSIIVSSSTPEITKLRGGLLSLSYVLGTAVTYTAAGVLAGASGEQLQAYFQNPWAIGLFSTLFAALALSLFGFYELQMPSFIQSRLQERTQGIRGGSFLGTFALGLVSALIVGACVSPLLITALGAAITSRDPWLGGAIMFSMSLGMGVFLVALGIGAGFLLPKAGPWMDQVKHSFGVMLLAVAVYMLGALPQVPVLLLWAVLLIVTAMYLGATESLPAGARGWQRFWKGLGTVILVWGILALLGGLAGERDIFRPLPQQALGLFTGEASRPAAATPAPGEALFERVTTLAQLEARLGQARVQGKPVLLDYYATWCTDCVRMEKATFSEARVRTALGRFALIQADVTENNDDARAIKQRFGIFGPPATLFFDARGTELKELRFYGFRPPAEFLPMLEKVTGP